MRTLVIEDEPQLARHIRAALVRHGHISEIQHDGADGLRAALSHPPDLVVLDVNLPTLDGFSVLARLRAATTTTRVLMLTARGDVEDRVRGLKSGADDYLTKPFDMEELIARVEALGRRAAPPGTAGVLQMRDLHMNVQQRRVTRDGQIIALSPREFELLQVMMEEPGRVFARSELFDRVWQRELTYETRTVEMFVARLRKKIDAGFAVPLIHTIRHLGYTVAESHESPRTP